MALNPIQYKQMHDTVNAFKTALKTLLFRWLFVHPVAYTSRPCNRFMLQRIRNCQRYYYYYYYYAA